MTPLGAESEFFAFFELTDKGTSWLGPLVLAFMTEGFFFCGLQGSMIFTTYR